MFLQIVLLHLWFYKWMQISLYNETVVGCNRFSLCDLIILN